MIKNKRNNFILTVTVFVILMGSASSFLLVSWNQKPARLAGHFIAFASDSGKKEQFTVDSFAKIRRYTKYDLTADSLGNLQILEKARQRLNLIKENRDTVNGIHIHLADNTPYSFFIRSIDICSEKKPHAFAPNKNDIYAWYLSIPPKNKNGEIIIDK